MVMNRSTPAPNAGRLYASHPNNLADNLSNLSVGDDDTVNTAATTGVLSLSSPAATSERIRFVFSSAPTTLGHHFWGWQWVDINGSSRVSIELTMSSIPKSYYSYSITQNGNVLLISCRLPTILIDSDRRNISLYRRPNGDPIYGPEHFRSIAQRAAVQTLTDSSAFNGSDVVLTQEIRLPFPCAQELVENTDGRPGETCKRFKDGMMVTILEVIERDYREKMRRNNRGVVPTRRQVAVDDVSYVGTTLPIAYHHTADESVMSLDGRGNPIARPLRRSIPLAISVAAAPTPSTHPIAARSSVAVGGVMSMQGIVEGNEDVVSPGSRKRQSTGSEVTIDSFAAPPQQDGYQRFNDRFYGPDHDPLL